MRTWFQQRWRQGHGHRWRPRRRARGLNMHCRHSPRILDFCSLARTCIRHGQQSGLALDLGKMSALRARLFRDMSRVVTFARGAGETSRQFPLDMRDTQAPPRAQTAGRPIRIARDLALHTTCSSHRSSAREQPINITRIADVAWGKPHTPARPTSEPPIPRRSHQA